MALTRSAPDRAPIRKRYGQNFLIDPNIAHRMIDAMGPRRSDHLFEIGPGRGALTDHLIGLSAGLDVIEIDRDLVHLLREKYQGRPVTIHQGDVLTFDFRQTSATGPVRVIGNLPYNISTPLIFRLLAQGEAIEDMHLMLQREVVDRLVAEPATSAYGRLGIMAGYHCKIERCFSVPPSAFRPQPKVHSAVVRLRPYRQLPVPAIDPVQLQKVVTLAFTQRRKVLRNSLGTLISEPEIASLDIDPRSRPDTLHLCQFVRISDYLITKESG